MAEPEKPEKSRGNSKIYIIMVQNESIYAELDARLDVSEARVEWCDHCNQGHPAPLD